MNNQGITPEELELLLAGPAHPPAYGPLAKCLALWKDFLDWFRHRPRP